MERRIAWSPASVVLMLGVFLLSFGLVAPRAWAVGNHGDNANAGRLLNRANYQAIQLNKDANQMTALINSNVGWRGRVDDLVRVKQRVNKLGKVIYELQSSQADASPWQKKSIDHVVPLLQYMAVNTTDEINYLNSHHDFPDSPQYTNLANQSAQIARELSGRISDIARYSKDKSQLARLSNTLNLPTRITRANG